MSIQYTRRIIQRQPSLSSWPLWRPRLNDTAGRQYSSRTLPRPPAVRAIPVPESQEAHAIKTWAESFRQLSINDLRDADGVRYTFSRSSGPGGQNVNKVNTKVTLRCDINSPWVPKWAVDDFVKDPHYVESSHSLLVTSTFTRSQAQNIDDCLQKLKNLVLAVAMSRVKNPTSEETKKRVSDLIKADKGKRKAEKEYKSNVKQIRSRSKRGFGFE